MSKSVLACFFMCIRALMGLQKLLSSSSGITQSFKSLLKAAVSSGNYKTNICFSDNLDAKHHLFPLALSERGAANGLTFSS